MKLLLLIHLFLFSPSSIDKGPDTLISCHFNNVPFVEFCDFVYRESGTKIYYHESWVKGVSVSLDADKISVRDAVEQALKGSGLEVSSWNNGLVILPGEKLPRELPHFEIKKVKSDTTGGLAKQQTQSEGRYLRGRKPDVTKILQVGKHGLASRNSKVTIRGRITELQTGEPVIGATMYLEEIKSGTSSDQNGFLSMALKPGNYIAVFAYMGLESKKYQLEVLSDGEFSVEMGKSVIQMTEVVVYGDRQMSIRTKDPGLEKISAKSIKEIPMLMGERDILKVSEMLPGIVTVGEGAAGLNVRGGNYDQNAFYINRIPVYNPTHLFGFFPAFNADIINDFSIYKGHIPSRYGGRLSSIFNIIARQGNRKRFTARGGVSPVAASISVEGPLKKDKSSFLLSARSLYSDWILRKIKDPVIRTSKAGFSDYAFSWNYSLRKSQLSVFAYHSQDQFKLSNLSSYNYANSGASFDLNHNFNASMRGDFSITAAQYSFNTTDQQVPPKAY